MPLLVITGAVMGVALSRIYSSTIDNLEAQNLRELNFLAGKIDNQLAGLSNIAQDTAAFIGQAPELDESTLYSLLRSNTRRDELIYGSALAFEPFRYKEEQRLFAPYVFGPELQAIDIAAIAYDYTSENQEWYYKPATTLQATWTEPYLDSGAGDVYMTTYSVPVLSEGNLLAVTTIDIQIETLSATLTEELGGQKFMLISPAGTFISHYNPALAMNSNLSDYSELQNSDAFASTAKAILAGNTGASRIRDLYLDGEVNTGNTWLFYTPVPSAGWFLTTIVPEAEVTAILRAQIQTAILGLGLMILLIFILVWLISSRLTRPIKILEAAVTDVARGKLDTHIENIRSLDELGRLSIGFNRMLKNLKKQIQIQSQQAAAQQMVEKELQMARDTQRSLLPSDFPPFPDRKEFELHAVNQAARHVAGDFFDYFLINPKTLVFVIADVSGKGMSAALVMAVTRTIVRDLAQSGKSPAEILRQTNERLRESQKGTAFVTIFLGCYSINNGKILYANGGHSPPFKIDKSGSISSLGEATGTIVGMLENQEYKNAEMRLLPGETLLLYTDGFPEARAASGEFFGEARIKTFLEHNTGSSPSMLCEGAIKLICDFQDHNLADDITLLALKRNPGKLGTFLSDLIK